MNKDYYQALGVSKDADDVEIKIAYRRIALLFFPDKTPDPEIFKQASVAYSVLSDPEKRMSYDMFGEVDLLDCVVPAQVHGPVNWIKAMEHK